MKLTIEITEGQNADGLKEYVFTLTDTNGKVTVGDAVGSDENLADAVAAAIKAHLSAAGSGSPDTAEPREPWLP